MILKMNMSKFMVSGTKDEVVGVVTTYITREICFHISGIDYLNVIWKKLTRSMKIGLDNLRKS
jgi:hypothetical protein